MNNQLNLFYDDNTQKYYWVGDDHCDKCMKPIIHVGYMKWDYTTNNFQDNIYCYGCRKEVKKTVGKYIEIKRVFLVPKEQMPTSSIGVFPGRPELVDGELYSVWGMAKKVDSEHIQDNTVACHNPNFMIQSQEVKQYRLTAGEQKQLLEYNEEKDKRCKE